MNILKKCLSQWYLLFVYILVCFFRYTRRRIQIFWKGETLYVGHHDWPTKKLLGFIWSKKAKITLETVKIFLSVFSNFPYFYNQIKPYQWNLILVMIITQIDFFYWQNVYIWRLIKVNYKRSLHFVVVPAKRSSKAKRKFLQIITIKYKPKMPNST